ncbi:hypothetical protein KKD52_11795 [Myxococcota bacterium]|jgi:predicted CoA-substrate-specific enzyme activase|nr:hypothetical protein [Myxococcota bacterium]MBU1412334.1 hypothetical protein [Myxococcota bacterium]MBU1511037.1 hypothetical protein [Myxococcota bacterium]PKN23925.1 MAG: hypothetical protein CVU65_13230 [Deltaproteobacteria bacterium HGW-Deltaproteobacteria-22]
MITAGIDIGTRFVKICLVREGRILGSDIRELNGTFRDVLRQSYRAALDDAGIFGFQVRKKAATGFGSNLVHRADFVFDEEMCAARAVWHLDPEARTVIDAGSLFLNLCTLSSRGVVSDKAVNEKCAAGSGRFLDMIAGSLGIPVEEISTIAATSETPYRMSNSCAVFAESEVISRINMGVPGRDILAGILIAIAEKAQTMIAKTGARPPVTVVGGLGNIPFFNEALARGLGYEVKVISMDPQLAPACGAALNAADRAGG